MKFLFTLLAVLGLVLIVQAQVDKSVCSLPKETGPCRGSKLSFYYDSQNKECKEFIYGGCQGNDNRFPSKDSCEKLCLERT